MVRYLGLPRNQIPTRILNNFCGEAYFESEKLFAISDSKGLVNGNRHVLFLLEHLEKTEQTECSTLQYAGKTIYLNSEQAALRRMTRCGFQKA